MGENQARDDAIARLKTSRMEITDEGLQQIAAWQYRPGTSTPIDNFLNKFLWTPGVNALPLWLAPNAVTLIGLFGVIIGYAVLVGVYCPDFSSPAPRWTYAFAAFTHFFYQTMDAMDGKQARRTNSSSPLGHLFDHGCDSVSVTFIALTVIASARLGFCPRGFFALFSISIPFWLAQWEEYHTHTMEHSLGGWIGITEGQLAGMLFIVISAVFGSEFWLIDVGLGTMPAWYCGGSSCPVTPREFALSTQGFAIVFFISKSILGVARRATDKRAAILQVVPIVLLIVLGFAWSMSPHPHPRVVMFSIGMVFTFLANKMIVAAICRMEYPASAGLTLFIPLPFLFAIERYELFPRHVDVLLGAYCCYCSYKVYRFIYNVVEEISTYLEILVFRIGGKQKTDDAQPTTGSHILTGKTGGSQTPTVEKRARASSPATRAG